jgi:hypothetical protein
MPTEEELEAERHKRFVAAFEALGRGETPDGKPMMAMDFANARLFRRQERARESWRRAPPDDLLTRRFR